MRERGKSESSSAVLVFFPTSVQKEQVFSYFPCQGRRFSGNFRWVVEPINVFPLASNDVGMTQFVDVSALPHASLVEIWACWQNTWLVRWLFTFFNWSKVNTCGSDVFDATQHNLSLVFRCLRFSNVKCENSYARNVNDILFFSVYSRVIIAWKLQTSINWAKGQNILKQIDFLFCPYYSSVIHF